MRENRVLHWIAIAAMLQAGILLSGCSAFESSKKMDMAPFSENTGTLFVEAAKVARPFRWNYLKPHIDMAEFKGTIQSGRLIFRGLNGIVNYSNQIVALNTARLNDRKKNEYLARYITDAMRRVADQGMLDSIGVTQTALDTVLQDIREAKTYLDGIAAAGPLVNAIVRAMGDRLMEIQEQVPTIVSHIELKVELDYAGRRANYLNLVDLRTRSMRAMTLLYGAKLGDPSALDTLLREDPSLLEFIPSREKVTTKGLAAAESSLTERLNRLDVFIHQMDQDVALYTAKLRELEEWRLNVDERIKITRDAMVVWAQSHRNLGAGIPVPPLIDVTGVAKNLVKTVVPLP